MRTSGLLLPIFWMLFCLPLNGQQKGDIYGVVLDGETGRPLSRANIVLVGTPHGASSDEKGAFAVTGIPVGTYTLKASFVGYGRVKRSVTVSAEEIMVLRLKLVPTILPGQTILVEAMRGRERETPATFSTIGRAEILERYTFQDIPIYLSELPSTTHYSESGNGIGYNYITIRGFDQRRLAVMINGIPQNDPEDHNVYWLDFPDLLANIEEIQVQRGAGSAFYGPPAIGGSVNLITSTFPRERNVSLAVGAGSYNTQRYSIGTSSGLVGDRYVLYGRVSRLTSSGYRENAWSTFDSYFLGAVRYDEKMTTQIQLFGGPFEDHLTFLGIPKSDIGDREKRRANPSQRPDEIENFSQPHYELFHEWRPSESVTLNNTIFLVEGEGFFDFDASWADTTMLRLTTENGFNPTGNPVNALVRAFVDNIQYGWFPRLKVDHSRGSLTAGAELRRHKSCHWGSIRWAQNLPTNWVSAATADYHFYEYHGGKDIVSLYLQELYRVKPKVTLMASLQYVFNRYLLHDEKFIGTNFRVSYHFFNPRLGVNVNLTENVNAYTNVAFTSREPRRKNLYDATFSWTGEVPQFRQRPDGSFDFDEPLVQPENLLDIELGTAYSSTDFRIAVNLYWMEFHDEIVKSGQLDLFGQPITGNAERTRHRGAEVSGRANLFENLEIQGNLTLSRNELTRHTTYVERTNPVTGQDEVVPVVLDGNRIAGFPDFITNARVTYRHEGWFASMSFQHVGDQFTTNLEDETLKVDSYSVFNLIGGYRLTDLFGVPSVEVRLQVNNVFDSLYAAFGEGTDFFPAAERNVFVSLKLNI